MEYYTATKSRNLAICDEMDGPWGYYAMWNKSDKERPNTVWFHLYVESKKQTNEQTKHKLIDTENRLVVTRGERGWGVGEIGEGGQLYGDGW